MKKILLGTGITLLAITLLLFKTGGVLAVFNEITSPSVGENVFGLVSFDASYTDEDANYDPVLWAIRQGTCDAGIGTVFGNVDGHSDTFSWDGTTFHAEANVSGWTPGMYCFVFNPQEDAGAANIRLTRAFEVVDYSTLLGSCAYVATNATKTIILTENCITDHTIYVPDMWMLDGAGYSITGVDPDAGHFLGAIVQNFGTTANVTNLTVTSDSLTNVCDDGDNRLRGIMFNGASGAITNNTVSGINQGASGCQEGNAIEVRNAPFDGTHPNTMSVEISGNKASTYQKTGILANGDVRALVTNNIVEGAGPVPYIAQNGIQLGFGASGEVRGNQISSNYYSGDYWVSGALLLYDVEAKLVKHSNNLFRNNQRNLLLITSQSLQP
jgi:hypothetical protein